MMETSPSVSLALADGDDDLRILESWLAQPRLWEYLGPPYDGGRYGYNHISYAIRTGRCRYYIVRLEGVPVGFYSYAVSPYHRKAEWTGGLGSDDLSYKGVMASAAAESIRLGFEEIDLHSIYTRVMQYNVPVMRGLSALGFHEVGVEREGFRFRDRLVDLHWWQLLRRDWEGRSRDGEL